MNLSEAEQQTFATELADALIEDKLPLNGLGEAEKAFKYFVATQNRASLGQMVDVRREPNTPFHQTKNTPQYYQIVSDVLVGFVKDNPDLSDKDLLHIFGWAIRLAKYRYATRSGSLSLRTNHRTPYSEAPKRKIQREQLSSRKTPRTNKRETSTLTEDVSIQIGQRFNNVRVIKELEGGVIVDLGSDNYQDVIATIRNSDAGGKKYVKGNQTNVEVIETKQRKDGRTIVFLKPVASKKKEKK